MYEKVIRFNIPPVNHPTIFVRRKVYEKYGLFSVRIRLSMDYEFFLRMFLNNIKGICLKTNISCMRLEGASYKAFIISLREVLLCSIIYGQSIPVGLALYTIRVFKGKVRRTLENLGFRNLTHELRIRLERNYTS